ncbi:pyocin knob domain-containing protein [Aeromonas sp. MR16]|uniref:pyocin knob domain-containing protein n=1 Tax=Aeromonas sp. MR16 TaxID=2923420 RepID=UPI001F4B1254|nr:pyocin knob domain-containing protein [Aeromonas sp. MR16]MCH7370037.1 pyocin knob domain-containing protein [Aeromonas sp. MR16]
MAIEHVQNGETGLAAREKINAAISVINELVDGGGAQPGDATLTALAGLDTSANKMPYFTDHDVATLTTLTPFARSLLDDDDVAAALTTLGVSAFIQGFLNDADAAIARATLGAQASDATLTALAGLAAAADKLPYFTGADTAAIAVLTAFARTLLEDADAAAALTTLGVSAFIQGLLNDADAATARATLGAQASDTTLTALAGLATAADKLPYFTDTDVADVTVLTAFARTLLDDADATTARATLGAQASDATLTTLAGLATAADKLPYFTDADVADVTVLTAFARTLLDDADATTARATLGAQASDATLTTLAGLATAADKLPYFTDADVADVTVLTAFARTLLDDADATTARATLGAQASDATLTALAGLVTATDKLPYFTGADTAAVAVLTAFARTLLEDADAAAALTTLGVSSFIQGLLNDADATTARATLGAQASDATLTALAGLATAADKLPYFTGADTAAVTVLTAFARTLLEDADAAAALTTLGVSSFIQELLNDADATTARATLGAQASDTTLTALAGLATAADKLPYFTGADTAAVTVLTAFARTLLEDADAATARGTLGAAAASHSHLGTIPAPIALGASEHLDDLKAANVYYQSANANAATARGYPEAAAGTLIVTTAAGPVQQYYVYNSSRVYIRAQYSTGAWTVWAKQYNTQNKPSAADVGAVAPYVVLPTGTDLNTVQTSGFYRLAEAGSGHPNCPNPSGYGQMIVSAALDTVAQIYIDPFSGATYIRSWPVTGAAGVWNLIFSQTHLPTAAQGNSDIVANGYGQVGSYAFLWSSNVSPTGPGFIEPGANVHWADGEGGHPSGTAAGTWKLMGARSVPATDNFGSMSSLWIRIA